MGQRKQLCQLIGVNRIGVQESGRCFGSYYYATHISQRADLLAKTYEFLLRGR